MLSPVEPAEVSSALAAALAGGPPIAPLPPDPVSRRTVEAMLQPGEPVTEPDAAAVVATSGSTGAPKGVVLSRAAVVAAAQASHRRLGGPGDWVLALPTHYVAGLMVVARALTAGTGVYPVGGDLRDLAECVGGLRHRSYLSLVPTQLARAMSRPRLIGALTEFDAVLLGGGPVPRSLVSSARDARIRIVTTYGLSETCGGVVYDGMPLDGVRIELEPPHDRIVVAAPMLFSGYRLRPDLTAEALAGARFRTPDRGRWAGARLEVTGRLDEVVVSGGLKIDLGMIEQAAGSWADRRAAQLAVLALPDAEWGVRVVAVTDARDGDLADLRAELGRQLPAYALPKQLIRRADLPRTAGGKIDRHRLRTELTSSAEAVERIR